MDIARRQEEAEARSDFLRARIDYLTACRTAEYGAMDEATRQRAKAARDGSSEVIEAEAKAKSAFDRIPRYQSSEPGFPG